MLSAGLQANSCLRLFPQVPTEGLQEPQDATKGRCLRRTVSVPSEGQFPEYPPDGAAKLGK